MMRFQIVYEQHDMRNFFFCQTSYIKTCINFISQHIIRCGMKVVYYIDKHIQSRRYIFNLPIRNSLLRYP